MLRKFLINFILAVISFKFIFCQNIWHSNFLDISDKNIDEVIVKNVSVDVNFSLNSSVNYWKSITVRNGSYAIGITDDQIIILKITRNELFQNSSIESRTKAFNSKYVDATLFESYNKATRKNDLILVAISSEGRLEWYSIEELKLFWSWNVGYHTKKIKIKVNPVLERKQLFISTENELNVYNFEVKPKKLWLAEKLTFPNTIGSFDLATYRDQFHVLVTQKTPGKLQIFRFQDGRFQTHKNISAAEIEEVVVFQENFRTFFAIDGLDAGIYQFGKRNSIFKERIINSHLEGVKYWLPVVMNNPRKNLILFAQRILEHGTHKSLVTEIFTYNGKNFEEHEDVPCQMFGENFNNLQCLSNDENLMGIKGAAAVTLGNSLQLFLANRNTQCLYHVQFETRVPENPVQSEIKILNDTKNELQHLLNEIMKIPESFPTKSEAGSSTITPGEKLKSGAFRVNITLGTEDQVKDPVVGNTISIDLLSKLDTMLINLKAMKEKVVKIEGIEAMGKFKKLIINGSGEIENVIVKQVRADTLNKKLAEETLQDIVRRDKDRVVSGTKTFTDLDVENLYFETFNGNNSMDILFKNSKSLDFNGNLTFEKPVTILNNIEVEKINEFPSASIVDKGRNIPGILSFENIDVGELQTGEINKLPISETWFHTNNTSDSNENSDHDIIYIPHNLTVKRVNGEEFESLKRDLIFVNIETHLPGKFTVHGNVTVEEPSSTNFLNKLYFPDDYIFKNGSSSVVISGRKIFEKTLRSKEMRMFGNYLNGVRSAEFITLNSEQNISGRAVFNNLEVTGEFQHDGRTTGDKISEFVPNLTMRDTDVVRSNVHFDDLEVTGSIIVEEYFNSNNLKEVLDDIVYKDEEDTKINSIKTFPEGLTIRKDLTITSNAINLIPLEQIVTKNTYQTLDIEQLNGNVSIERLEVGQLINGVNVTKLDQETVKIFGEQFITSTLIFKDDFHANNLDIVKTFNDIPVENFVVASGDRIIRGNFTFDDVQGEDILVEGNFKGNIEEIDLENFEKNRMSYINNQSISSDFTLEKSVLMNVECGEINSVNCSLLDVNDIVEGVLNKISSGEVMVKNVTSNENLKIERMDGILLTEVKELEENLITIYGNVHFADIKISKLSEVDFGVFLDNVVFKNETNISLNGTKVFQSGFTVKKLIETKILNNVPIENLTYLDMNDDIYIIKDDIVFHRISHIYNLEIMGSLNNENVQNILHDIAYITNNLSFSEEQQFLQNVTIGGNLDIKMNFNGFDLSSVNDNIVYWNKPEDANVESLVTFTGLLTFVDGVAIETNLATNKFFGFDLETWVDDLVFINKGLLQGQYHFEKVTIHDKLSAKFINNICMNRTIPLGTDQEIPELHFKNVVFLNNISVDGFVNGLNLKEEYLNTVLSNEEQEILSEINFHHVALIRNKLEIAGLLNGFPIDKIVTTTTNQNLSALYKFSTKVNLNSNLYIDGLVNSINMSHWENGSVKMISKEPQEITAPWHVKGNLTFDEPVDGESVISNFQIDENNNLVEHQMVKKMEMEEQFKKDQEFICKDIRYLSRKLQKQIYRFETFEELLVFNYPLEVSKIYFFMDDEPILLITGVDSCTTDLFIFRSDQFIKISEIFLGEIDQIIPVRDNKLTHFVVKSVPNSKCNVNGTNVWQYEHFTAKIIQNIEEQQILQESMVPSTFYTLNKYGVTEFKIDVQRAVIAFPYRKWKIREENMAFVPRGLRSGLAVRTGHKVIRLLRDEPIVDNGIDFEESFLKGDIETLENDVLPGRNNNKITVVNVGPKNIKRSLLAIAFHEETVVEKNLDSIKIYESYSDNTLFQKIPTYNPTSLLSLEFENGETLLLIFENGEKLQIYQYSGNEGFKRRLTADIFGNHMFKLRLPLEENRQIETVGFVNKNKISILKPVMLGNNIDVKFEC
ncbi:hypothetical protein WA026_006191 [Henosepilachna vigintioctopunctata]|uniref:Uncharacterized protein n=1 Tax=Henosepilachna vigintioctopunctata TaxID=420089 RepID=A0AAW1TP38_9CUCU